MTTRTDRLTAGFCLLLGMAPIISVDASHGMAFLPAGLALIFYALFSYANHAPLKPPRDVLVLCAIILGLAGLSLLWAAHPDVSAKQIPKLTGLLIPQILLFALITHLNTRIKKHARILYAYGIIACTLFLGFEIFTQGFFYNLMRGHFPPVPADPDEFNCAAIVISLHSFAAYHMLKTRLKSALAFMALYLPLGLAVISAQSQSAQLCLLVGLFFLFAFPYHAPYAKYLFRTLKYCMIAVIFIAPFAITPIYHNFAGELQNYKIMQNAYAGIRLEIWDFIARYALQQPLHGYGIEVTRAITDFDSSQTFLDKNTAMHPHNFVMQIWIEFGLIGAVIASGLFYYAFTKLEKNYTPAQQKILLPTFMAALVPAAAAFGMWQGWWLASLFHLCAMALLIAHSSQDSIASKDDATAADN